MEKTMKGFFALIVIIIICVIAFRVNLVMNAKKDGKTIYEISVNKFNEVETYMTDSYTRDQQTGCIKFQDEFGIKRIVCNNYTITEY
jgi:hypothetical protein